MIRGISRAERQPTSDAQLAIMRSSVCDGAADRPGIYRMLSGEGEVLYVGKSKRVRSRLLSYFRCAFPEEKGARILRSAEKIEWEYTPSEFAALLQELRLIKRFRPRYNVAMMRDARGKRGSFVEKLQAYGRAGLPCPRCGAKLVATHAIDGRATTLCVKCQR